MSRRAAFLLLGAVLLPLARPAAAFPPGSDRWLFSFTDDVDDVHADDLHGDGTIVAGVLGGSTVGVAEGVSLVAVRVLDASGQGTTGDLALGIDWVAAQTARPAVANFSIGGPTSGLIDTAVQN